MFSLVMQDHNYSLASPESAAQLVLQLRTKMDTLEREKKNTLVREQRAKHSCKDYLKQLKEANLLTTQLEAKLEGYGGRYFSV